MSVFRLLPLSTLSAALFFTLSAQGADPVVDPKDNPLPKGAKVHLGNNGLTFRYAPNLALLPPDYKMLLVPDGAGVRRFEVATGLALDKPSGAGFAGGQMVVSADGKRMIVLRTGILTVKKVATGTVVQELRPPVGFSTVFANVGPSAVLTGDGKVLAQGGQGNAGKGEVLIWDVDKGTVTARLPTIHTGAAIPTISLDGKLLAMRGLNTGFVPPGKEEADVSRVIQVWDVENGKDLFRAKVSPGGFQITAVAFSPDNSTLVAACTDGVIDVWDVKTGKAKPPILGRTGQGVRVAFSPDGKTLAAVALDGYIQRWAIADGRPIGTTEGPVQLHVGGVQGIGFVNNETVVAWGTSGLSAMVWEAPSGKVLTPPTEHTAGIKSIAFAREGQEVVTSGFDGHVFRWDATTGKKIGTVMVRPARGFGAVPPPVLNLSQDATRAITVGPQPAVFDLTTQTETFAVPRGQIVAGQTYVFPSPDASKVALVSIPFDQKKSSTCAVWDLTTRKKLAEMEITALPGLLPAAAVNSSGTRLVLVTFARNEAGGQQVMVVTGWDLKTGKKLGEVEDMTAFGSASVAVASDTWAVVTSGSGRMRLFDYESGKGGDEIEAARPRGEVAGPIVFSPDGKSFAAGVSAEQPGVYGVRVYDWPRANVLHTFEGHHAPISALAFSPDGKTLASGSQDASVLLWDLKPVKNEKLKMTNEIHHVKAVGLGRNYNHRADKLVAEVWRFMLSASNSDTNPKRQRGAAFPSLTLRVRGKLSRVEHTLRRKRLETSLKQVATS